MLYDIRVVYYSSAYCLWHKHLLKDIIYVSISRCKTQIQVEKHRNIPNLLLLDRVFPLLFVFNGTVSDKI